MVSGVTCHFLSHIFSSSCIIQLSKKIHKHNLIFVVLLSASQDSNVRPHANIRYERTTCELNYMQKPRMENKNTSTRTELLP